MEEKAIKTWQKMKRIGWKNVKETNKQQKIFFFFNLA